MKIAVCLFGHLRTYEKCCKALRKNLTNGFDCDVFMHTWSTFDHNTQTWHKWKMKGATSSVAGKADKIKKAYGLSSLKIEEQQAADFGHVNANGVSFSIAGLRYMAQSMTESVCLASDDYDYIVVCRPDLLLKTPFPPERTSFCRIMFTGAILKSNAPPVFPEKTSSVCGYGKTKRGCGCCRESFPKFSE